MQKVLQTFEESILAFVVDAIKNVIRPRAQYHVAQVVHQCPSVPVVDLSIFRHE